MATLGVRPCPVHRPSRLGAPCPPRARDLPARVRPDPDGPGAPRGRWHLVPAQEDQEATQVLQYPAHASRRKDARSLGPDADDLQGLALERTDRAPPRRRLPLLAVRQ